VLALVNHELRPIADVIFRGEHGKPHVAQLATWSYWELAVLDYRLAEDAASTVTDLRGSQGYPIPVIIFLHTAGKCWK